MWFTVVKNAFALIVRALLTEKMMMRVMVVLGDWLVAKTTNKLDDKMWPDVKKALEESVGK